jgi:hypothetical protein
MSCTIIMESYDVFLMGNFLALPAFTKDYGVWNELKQENVVAPAWQSALQGEFQLFPFSQPFPIRSLHIGDHTDNTQLAASSVLSSVSSSPVR